MHNQIIIFDLHADGLVVFIPLYVFIPHFVVHGIIVENTVALFRLRGIVDDALGGIHQVNLPGEAQTPLDEKAQQQDK
ncbi:hypothetical protein SDC9_204767 [bioreactor metagenome]|uniref:Uncharacterized protein n=1 Tax=bioreactor metagenome TaxID=1076179 RepID=A0A645JC07_9ZZZZ